MPPNPNRGARPLSTELEAKLLRRLAAEWRNVNDTFFRGVLRAPTFQLSDTRTRLGAWHEAFRTLEVSRHLVLERTWGEVVEVLKHEIAHQFVDECMEVDESPHGRAFQSVCERLGIRGTTHVSMEDRQASGEGPTATDRLVARIQKLLALAESANQHEAENAATAAQKLMLRFNIEMDELAPSDAARAFGFRHLGKPSGRIFEHQRRVAVILDEHFFVEAIWVPVYRPHDGKRASVLEICGSEANLAMAEHVHEFLHAASARLWDDYKRERGIRSNRDRRTFLAGVMGGFEAKLDAQRVQFREEGLVWVPRAALGQYFRRRHPYVQTVRHGGSHRNEAFADGHRAGGSIVLSKPVREGAGGGAPRALDSAD